MLNKNTPDHVKHLREAKGGKSQTCHRITSWYQGPLPLGGQPSIHSCVHRTFPRGGCATLGSPWAFQADSRGLAGGGCPEHREAAPPEHGAPRSCVRFPLGIIFPLRPPGPGPFPAHRTSTEIASRPRCRQAARSRGRSRPGPAPHCGPRPVRQLLPPLAGPSSRPSSLPHRPRRPRPSPATG